MERRPKRHRETAYREVAGEGGLVVLPSKAEVKVLNPVGSKVYSLLDGQHTVEQIVQAVMDEFEIDADTARKDVEGFLNDLAANRMLEEAEGEASR